MKALHTPAQATVACGHSPTPNRSARAKRPVLDQHRGIHMVAQASLAMLGILILSPLMLAIALLIKLESRGPVLFSQTRVGKHNKRFNFFKFRTMYLADDPKFTLPDPAESDREGVCLKFKHDPRVTKLGRVLRKYSLDELPQLLNVVLGDMALIGPRPALPIETELYRLSELQRLAVMPGITGLWQVSGRAELSFKQQMALDLRYIAKQGFWFDVQILWRTLPAVIFARGAY